MAKQKINKGSRKKRPSKGGNATANIQMIHLLSAALVGAAVAFWFRTAAISTSDSSLHPMVATQKTLNKSSRDSWQEFASHRSKVMKVMLQAATEKNSSTKGQHAILFGPGNCNDLDLPRLLERQFESLALVDIDNATVRHAVDRQLGAAAAADHEEKKQHVIVSPSVDLSHTVAHTADWNSVHHKSPPRNLYENALRAVMETTNNVVLQEIGTPASVLEQGGYDIAVSLCLLSQFSGSLSRFLEDEGSKQMDFIRMLLAIRQRHIDDIVQSLRPGGTGILVVDMVGTETLPELFQTGDDDDERIERLTKMAEQTGNFFHGTKRAAVTNAVAQHKLTERVQLWGKPWKWTMSSSQHYIVYCVLFQRRSDAN